MNARPDPKELLDYVKQQELLNNQNQGKLKIFLGAAPGVGKTYTMLESAIEALKNGVDVVVGLVETHGRLDTKELLNKLEILPRCEINYHGKQLLEFDLDAVLKRSPRLVLVDEMAHANIPGTRHSKRWQDILELLDRGIDVYTTLNVQHIESLNNIITQLINIVVQETVPDPILERAHAIELIDLPVEDLLKRLQDGKVYIAPDVIGLATDHFFREENLIALRELALRVTAEQVNAEELLHRTKDSIEKIWPTKEKLLVCIGIDAISSKLIRIGFRMAKKLQAEWIALHIESANDQASEEENNLVIKNLRLVEQLGGQTVNFAGSNIAIEIIKFAKDCNITKIILGRTIRSTWKELLMPSIAAQLVRLGDNLDLYIISNHIKNIKFFNKNKNYKNLKINNTWLTICITVTILCYLINNLLCKFLGINVCLSNKKYLIVFFILMFLSHSLIYLNFLLQKQKIFFCHREQSIATLHLLNKELARTRGLEQLLKIAILHISSAFDSEVFILLPDLSVMPTKLIAYNKHNQIIKLSTKEQSVAEWVYNLGQSAGLGTQTLSNSNIAYIPMLGASGKIGVLRVLPNNPIKLLNPGQLHLLEKFCNHIALSLEVEMLQKNIL